MKHLFLDTNIIIDIFAARTPFDISAIELYRLAKDNSARISGVQSGAKAKR